MLFRTLRYYGFVDFLEEATGRLPFFLKRPLGRAVVFCYCLEGMLPVFTACAIVGAMGSLLFLELPLPEGFAAASALLVLLALIWKQWCRIERLQEQLSRQEDEENCEEDAFAH